MKGVNLGHVVNIGNQTVHHGWIIFVLLVTPCVLQAHAYNSFESETMSGKLEWADYWSNPLKKSNGNQTDSVTSVLTLIRIRVVTPGF